MESSGRKFIIYFFAAWKVEVFSGPGSVTGHKFGPHIANCRSVILMGAGLSADDLEFESLLCRYQLTKYTEVFLIIPCLQKDLVLL